MPWFAQQNTAGFTHPPIVRRQAIARAETETGQIEPARFVHGRSGAAGFHFEQSVPQTSQERCGPFAAVGTNRFSQSFDEAFRLVCFLGAERSPDELAVALQ